MIPSVRTTAWSLIAFAAAAPLSVSAATFKEIVEGPIFALGDLLVQLLYLVAFVFFLFGMFKYFFSSGANAEENRQKGRQFMLWGILGLVVLFAIWGIINLFLNLLESWA